MDDAIAITLKRVARTAYGPALFFVETTFAARRVRSPGRAVAHFGCPSAIALISKEAA